MHIYTHIYNTLQSALRIYICTYTPICYHAEHACNECNMMKRRKYIMLLKAVRNCWSGFQSGYGKQKWESSDFVQSCSKGNAIYSPILGIILQDANAPVEASR